NSSQQPAAHSSDEPVTLAEGRFLKLMARGRWEYAERRNVTGVVTIVAVTRAGEVLLTEQHRPPVDGPVIEYPAGLAGDIAGAEHESLDRAARRERLEETGYDAAEWISLYTGTSSAGLTSETLTFFAALDAEKVGPGGGHEGESITVHAVPLQQVPE